MCYKKPGPRCSYHAKQRVDKTKAKYMQLRKELESLPNPNSKEPLFVGEDDRETKLVKARENYEAKRQQASTAFQEYQKAVKEHLETPEGIEMMVKQLENTDNDIERGKLKSRIETAQTKRNAQLKMYNEIYNKAGDLKIMPADMSKDELVAVLSRSTPPDGSHLSVEESEKIRKAHLMVQHRADKLVSYFLNDNGDYYAPAGMVEEIGRMNAAPGYKFLDAGSYRAAFLDEKTGYVIKIPIDDRIGKNDLTSESDLYSQGEQEGYSELDLEGMRNDKVEYAQTFFYTASDYPRLPIVVQQYLSDDEYSEPEDIPDDYYEALEVKHNLWDVSYNNVRVHKKSGTVMLFDCLPNGTPDDNYDDYDSYDERYD